MKSEEEIKKQLLSARDEYINLIKAELLGPGSEFLIPDIEHELISSNPISRYSLGILYPQEIQINQDNDETVPIIGEGSEEQESDQYDDTLFEKPEDSKASNPQKPVFNETDEENLDEEICLSSQYMPSSMGITFCIKGNSDQVNGKISFATYRKAEVSDCIIPFNPPDNSETYSIPTEFAHKFYYDKKLGIIRLLTDIKQGEFRDISKNSKSELNSRLFRLVDFYLKGYVRVPHSLKFTLNFFNNDYIDQNKNLDGTTAKITALRTKISDDLWSLTVMLVNDSTLSPIEKHTCNCLFQAKITIVSDENDFIFKENNRKYSRDKETDQEDISIDLLYRNKKIYGTGLGSSVDWRIDTKGHGSIWSDFFPQVEVPPMSFDLPEDSELAAEKLSMKFLSDLDPTSKQEKLNALVTLINLYKRWIDNLEETAKQLDPRYKTAATKNISECRKAYIRMSDGIRTLETNEKAYSAFMLANRAMFMQRIQLKMQSDMANIERYPDDAEITKNLIDMDYYKQGDANSRWRPFQIAFLLLDINSIVFDNHTDRNLIDLIWFPTGGGKTEAYLGLTAFTIFYRRLAYPNESSGTTVIMRYTLRLLTAQQFTRAATLICACEYIRQDCVTRTHKYPSYSLGNEAITIGLWIGSAHTPNTNEEAKKCLGELHGANKYNLSYTKERYNKFQVLKCPWCGTKLVMDMKEKEIFGKWGYAMKDGKHFYMFCPQEVCKFSKCLPIQIIDDELYRSPPTLLFGTVDKFAMLPWNGDIGSFFAVGSNNRTPELIIQDELHLISGALGSIVGLYETVIDALCGKKGESPKIIASTATIRRAREQCSVLYDREVVQFPAPGIDADDSFFAREATISKDKEVFGRKYIGLLPSGKTKAMMEIRATAALLQKMYTMNLVDEVKDKLWTLTVYFNSLKDLGKASTLVDDDIKDFIVRTANRMFKDRRLIVNADELTSRITTVQLNETLDKLEKTEYSKQNKEAKKYASNILLATNMISVGIDIARLNVMLMIGQPKLTSEYIQASSRIGRSFPGVAFIQFDATKSRDRSHYEQFKAYHESFYRYVEPTGATPFSKPARERALHAVITAILRQYSGLTDDKDAKNFSRENLKKEIAETEFFIIERIKSIKKRSNNSLKDDIDEIRAEIKEFIDWWQTIVTDSNSEGQNISVYFGRRFMFDMPKNGEKRLFKQYNASTQDEARETLTSMRNVDTQVKGYIAFLGENDYE